MFIKIIAKVKNNPSSPIQLKKSPDEKFLSGNIRQQG
jgi:hypothetical protein